MNASACVLIMSRLKIAERIYVIALPSRVSFFLMLFIKTTWQQSQTTMERIRFIRLLSAFHWRRHRDFTKESWMTVQRVKNKHLGEVKFHAV